MLPIYIINLAQDHDKKKHMQSICQKLNTQVEFINAVDGSQLPQQKIEEMTDFHKTFQLCKRQLTPSEIGCSLSHKAIYEKILAENINKALIFEDDVDFSSGLLNQLIEKIENLDLDSLNWEIILLHSDVWDNGKIQPQGMSFWFKQNLFKNYFLKRTNNIMSGAYAYIINQKGVHKMLQHLTQFYLPLDIYTCNSQFVNIYTIQPSLVQINQKLTLEQTNMKDRNIKRHEQNSKISFRIKNFLKKTNLFYCLKSIKIFTLNMMPIKPYQ